MYVEGDEPSRIDVALRERDQVLHREVVHRHLETGGALLREQSIDEDSAGAVVPELQPVDVDPGGPPVNA
jgi:hypothetical protein